MYHIPNKVHTYKHKNTYKHKKRTRENHASEKYLFGFPGIISLIFRRFYKVHIKTFNIDLEINITIKFPFIQNIKYCKLI